MKFCSIASGSSGNCIFAGSAGTSVLIDAGLSGKKIDAGLRTIDMTTTDIDGILVTHEHADHVKGLGVLARRYGIPIYATEGTIRAITENAAIGKIPSGILHTVCADRPFMLGDIEISPFSISHDAAEPVGYRLEHNGKTCAVATDMGCYDEYTVDHLRNLDVLLLESNHDVHMLEAGRYPYYLKRRILSEKGHLSNETAGQLLCRVLHEGISRIYLGHLSHENNYEDLAFATVCDEVTMGDNPWCSGDFRISIAHRDVPGEAVVF
ncbi:MAG: MBL fold metallo-hydrolase [Lachnospiraceae bacterium]|nr:MBL fold metallo-hydrolase [Lachnospiraceae bacterium]